MHSVSPFEKKYPERPFISKLKNPKWGEFIKHFIPQTLFGRRAVVYVPKINARYT
jgi:hypothetical protein